MALPSNILEKHFPTPDGHPDTEAIIAAMEEYAYEWKVKYDELKAENEALNQQVATLHEKKKKGAEEHRKLFLQHQELKDRSDKMVDEMTKAYGTLIGGSSREVAQTLNILNQGLCAWKEGEQKEYNQSKEGKEGMYERH